MTALFVKTKLIFRERKYNLENIFDPSILYIMKHPDLTVLNFMENSIGLKRVKVAHVILLFVSFFSLIPSCIVSNGCNPSVADTGPSPATQNFIISERTDIGSGSQYLGV